MQWTSEEEQYLLENYSSSTKDELLKKLKRKWGTIVAKAIKLNVLRKGVYSQGNLSNLLYDTPLSYYYIGLLIADGHFSKHSVDISLHEMDRDYLQKYSDYIENKREMSYRGKTYRTTGGQYRVNISNKELVDKIKNKFDLNNKKTYYPPKLTNIKNNKPDLYFCLLIGYIDGDGCINYRQNKKKDGYRESVTISIRCHQSWVNNLIEFEDFLYGYFNIQRNNKKEYPKLNKRFEAIFSINDMNLILSIKNKIIELGIYDNVMHRKWDKIDLNYKNPQFRSGIENLKKVTEMICSGKTVLEISKTISCTTAYIHYLINEHNLYGYGTGISKRKRDFWSDEEMFLLKTKYPFTKGKDICKYFPNRNYDSIIAKAIKHQIRKER